MEFGCENCYSRLCLDSHAAIKRNRVEGVGESILHILLKIYTASRVGAVVFGGRISHVPGGGSRVAGGNTGGMAHGIVTVHGRRGIGVCGVLVASGHVVRVIGGRHVDNWNE